ncbi:MAG: hypothetical protein CMJ24_07930 [Phycisphaerae bacterium]|nr:hypothetical protein [Phycisphaerae bacterium]
MITSSFVRPKRVGRWYLLGWLIGSSMLVSCAKEEEPPAPEPDPIDELEQQSEEEGWDFEIRPNELIDLENIDPDEFELPPELGGFEPPEDVESLPRVEPEESEPLPIRFDWREQGVVNPVRDQQECGSCWAFAACGAAESVHAIANPDLPVPDLSEQWLVDCNIDGWGCLGGGLALGYFVDWQDACGKIGGGVLEFASPYAGLDSACGEACESTRLESLPGWGIVSSPMEPATIDEVKRAIMEYGPVVADIVVELPFLLYYKGIYNRPASSGMMPNHAVVITGWDDGQGGDGIWYVRNSWGPMWGEAGTGRVAYGAAGLGYVVACFGETGDAESSSESEAEGQDGDNTGSADESGGGSDDAADGQDGADSGSGGGSDDAADGQDGADGADGGSGGDSGDAADGQDGTDGGSGGGSDDAADGQDGADGADGGSGGDSDDAADGQDGTDGGSGGGSDDAADGQEASGGGGLLPDTNLDEIAERFDALEDELDDTATGVVPPMPTGPEGGLDIEADLLNVDPDDLMSPLVGVWKQVAGPTTADVATGGYDQGWLVISPSGLIEFHRQYVGPKGVLAAGRRQRPVTIRTRLDWRQDDDVLVLGEDEQLQSGRLSRQLKIPREGGGVHRVTRPVIELPARLMWYIKTDGDLVIRERRYRRVKSK